MTNIILPRVSAAAILISSLTGCISDPKYVEEDFGNSVRQMVEAQIYDPSAASNPLLLGPEHLDGTAASEAILLYREAAKRRNERDGSTGLNITID